MYFSLLIVFLCLNRVLSSCLFSPCKMTDLTCIEKTVNSALPQILDGIPELGVQCSDPQYNDVVEISHPSFQLTLLNSTQSGYKKCRISNLKFNDNFTSISCNADCQGFVMSGKYDIKGRLIGMSVTGHDDFKITTGPFYATLVTEVEKLKGDDGKSHVVIKDFKVIGKPKTAIKYVFKNLNNENRDLYDAQEYMDKNWQEINEIFQYPIWYKSLETVARNVNKYLEQVALEEILLTS